jgi:hypothetical protein
MNQSDKCDRCDKKLNVICLDCEQRVKEAMKKLKDGWHHFMDYSDAEKILNEELGLE